MTTDNQITIRVPVDNCLISSICKELLKKSDDHVATTPEYHRVAGINNILYHLQSNFRLNENHVQILGYSGIIKHGHGEELPMARSLLSFLDQISFLS